MLLLSVGALEHGMIKQIAASLDSCADTVDPNREGFAEGGTRLLGRADEIGDPVPPASTTRSHIHPMRRACSAS